MTSSETISQGIEKTAETAKRIQLALLKNSLAGNHYPGYPEYRLKIPLNYLNYTVDGRLRIPYGTWGTSDGVLPSPADQERFLTQGLLLDSLGRPLHPWLPEMIEDPDIGILTGRGAYYGWGPNYTADPVIFLNDHVLLVKRKDTADWALPGGHLEYGESAVEAGVREAAEETDFSLPRGREPEIVYQGPVADLRITANAWPDTTAMVFQLGHGNFPEVRGQDDASEAAWIPLDLVSRANLHGSHRFLLHLGMESQGYLNAYPSPIEPSST